MHLDSFKYQESIEVSEFCTSSISSAHSPLNQDIQFPRSKFQNQSLRGLKLHSPVKALPPLTSKRIASPLFRAYKLPRCEKPIGRQL